MIKITSDDLKSLLMYSLLEKPGSYIFEEILHRFHTFAELIDVTEQELLTIEGVGNTRARQIIATLKLSRFISTPLPDIDTIRSPRGRLQTVRTGISVSKTGAVRLSISQYKKWGSCKRSYINRFFKCVHCSSKGSFPSCHKKKLCIDIMCA